MIKHCAITRLSCITMVYMVMFAFGGCSKSSTENISNSQALNTKKVSQIKSDSNSLSESQVQEYISKSQAAQIIVLSNGKLWDGSIWNGLNSKFLVLGIGSDEPITSIIGNHAEIISQEEVTISNGAALLVLVDRTQPAAEEAKTGNDVHSFEYWLIQHQLRPYPGRNDMKLAYVLFDTFTTSPSIARSNILELVKGWKTSDTISTSSKGIVKMGKYLGNTYNIYSSYIPNLTLENSNQFKLELEIGKSIEGIYRTDSNKLVLTSSDGDKSYIFNITNNTLVIEQGIPNYVNSETSFKLLGNE